ncbi:ATP-binding protein [bacterium]|nr:ATP-binding protein [bacterium]
MNEISLHILDIAQNSIRAGASKISIQFIRDSINKLYEFRVKDNGSGIDEKTLKTVTDPFTTTRKHRKVGLGLSLLEQSTKQSLGDMKILSFINKGTTVYASFNYESIDSLPVGDLTSVITILITTDRNINVIFEAISDSQIFSLSTEDILNEIGDDIPLGHIDVVSFVKDLINNELVELQIYG